MRLLRSNDQFHVAPDDSAMSQNVSPISWRFRFDFTSITRESDFAWKSRSFLSDPAVNAVYWNGSYRYQSSYRPVIGPSVFGRLKLASCTLAPTLSRVEPVKTVGVAVITPRVRISVKPIDELMPIVALKSASRSTPKM